MEERGQSCTVPVRLPISRPVGLRPLLELFATRNSRVLVPAMNPTLFVKGVSTVYWLNKFEKPVSVPLRKICVSLSEDKEPLMTADPGSNPVKSNFKL